ncbi:MAG: ATP-grasp domain-containing protein [Clostridia bacterium]
MEKIEKIETEPGPKIGIIYNAKKGIKTDLIDNEAEFDSINTVYAIAAALEKYGFQTALIEADKNIFKKLEETKIDLAFNIAEGIGGRGREAIVPSILEMYGIPYSGSDATTLSIALDKALTKKLLSSYGIVVAKSVTTKNGELPQKIYLQYPVIVKPNAEGSSKGIVDKCVVENEIELRELCTNLYNAYHIEFLAEEFIRGREFTIGIFKNGKEAKVLEPMEIAFKNVENDGYNVYNFKVKQNCFEYLDYICPAKINNKIRTILKKNAQKIYDVLDCKDFARVDFILSDDEICYFLEVNPLPGLTPDYSDLVMIAKACGIEYDELIFEIANSALKRHNISGGIN